MLRYHILDVFTDTPFGGNPLAVVLGADALQGAQMQRIAREFNLSETVFILPATDTESMSRLRIFTPFEELPFAGHPMVGAGCLLAQLGLVPAGSELSFAFEVGIGAVPMVARHADSLPYAELTVTRPPRFDGQAPDDDVLAAALRLRTEDLGYGDERPRVASCGLPTLLVPLRSPEAMAGIDVDVSALAALLAGTGARNLYVYARGYEGELRARMFMPGLGEDPATGSAAAALAGRLASESQDGEGTLEWTVLQGVEMGRPSRIRIAADRRGGQVSAVRVGGTSVRIMEGMLHAY